MARYAVPVMRLHRALAASGTAAATLALSACSFFSPVQTAEPYNPGDGVPAQLGAVAARNLVVVSDKAGGSGKLTGAVLNTGDASVQVSFLTREGADAKATPTGSISLGGRELKTITGVSFDKIPSAPGTMTEIYLVTPDGQQMVSVPVLPPTGVYADIK